MLFDACILCNEVITIREDCFEQGNIFLEKLEPMRSLLFFYIYIYYFFTNTLFIANFHEIQDQYIIFFPRFLENVTCRSNFVRHSTLLFQAPLIIVVSLLAKMMH